MSSGQVPVAEIPVDIRFEIRLNATDANWTRVAYDSIYSDDGIRHLDSFYYWILRVLNPVPGGRLLDVACGEGVLPNKGRLWYGLDAYGSDISMAALHIAAHEGASPFCASVGERLPFADQSFDYVTCIGSLEHFLDVRAGVAEMARVLRPQGVACILVPNTYGLLGNIYKAFKTGMSTVDRQPMQRYAARREWAMVFEQAGLRVVQTVKYEREPPISLTDWWWYVKHPRELVKLALTPFIPLNLATHFVYLCQPIARSSL